MVLYPFVPTQIPVTLNASLSSCLKYIYHLVLKRHTHAHQLATHPAKSHQPTSAQALMHAACFAWRPHTSHQMLLRIRNMNFNFTTKQDGNPALGV